MTQTTKEQLLHRPVPILWLSKADLLYFQPDLEERVGPLDDAEVAYLAEKLGDALQENYWLALEVVIEIYLGDAGKEMDDMD